MADLTGPNPDEVNGVDARGATVTGKPVLVGGLAVSLPSSVTAGQAVELSLDVFGHADVVLGGQGGSTDAQADNELRLFGHGNQTGSVTQLPIGPRAFNGTTWDRLRSTDSLDAAPNASTGILAVGIGPGFDRKLNPSNLGTAANSAITDTVHGANSAIFYIGTTTTGTITFEVTADDSNWVAADVIDTQANTWVSGTNLTPTSGKTYRIKTAGWRQVRVRTVTTLGATVAVKYTLTATAYFPPDLDGPPHAIGYTIASAANKYTTAQTSANLVAGTTGKRIYVTSLSIATGGTTAVRVSLYWGTGAFTAGTSPTLFDGEFAPSATVRPGMTQSFPYPPGGSSATGDNLRITTDAAGTVYVTVGYYVA